MWDPADGFYHDLDVKENRIARKHVGAFWTLLAEIPNEERAEAMIAKPTDPDAFGTENPFPCLPVDDPDYSENGNGFNGAVVPYNTFMVVKGLERYGKFEFARECAIRHLYFILTPIPTLNSRAMSGKPTALQRGPSGSFQGRFRRRYMPAAVSLYVDDRGHHWAGDLVAPQTVD